MSNTVEKRYDPADTTLKFVHRKDDITGDDEDVLHVEMSCGHAVDPNSLNGWCRSLLDQGKIKFHCPADVDGKTCSKEWTYMEIRRHALLTDEEQHMFEQKIAPIVAKKDCDYKQWPGCKTFVERQDLTNLRVHRIICMAQKWRLSEFCWQCLKPWHGDGTSSIRCQNEGCKDPRLEVLQTCKIRDLPIGRINGCPSIRACPTCGLMMYVVCKQCQVKFCFACLQNAQACQESKEEAWFDVCSKPIAPRQTAVPVWSQRCQKKQPSFTAPAPPQRQPGFTAPSPPRRQPSFTAPSPPRRQPSFTAPSPPRRQPSFTAPSPPRRQPSFTAPSPPRRQPSFTAPSPPRRQPSFTAPAPPQTQPTFTAPVHAQPQSEGSWCTVM